MQTVAGSMRQTQGGLATTQGGDGGPCRPEGSEKRLGSRCVLKAGRWDLLCVARPLGNVCGPESAVREVHHLHSHPALFCTFTLMGGRRRPLDF